MKRKQPPYENIDLGIRPYVKILFDAGVTTDQSCQGGAGHAYLLPVVEFAGSDADAFYALGVALRHGLPVYELRRCWRMCGTLPMGPHWELVFWNCKEFT